MVARLRWAGAHKYSICIAWVLDIAVLHQTRLGLEIYSGYAGEMLQLAIGQLTGVNARNGKESAYTLRKARTGI